MKHVWRKASLRLHEISGFRKACLGVHMARYVMLCSLGALIHHVDILDPASISSYHTYTRLVPLIQGFLLPAL